MRIVVLGAGIVGASAAYHLARLGAEVYLIDRDAPGRATFAGAGILCPWLSQVRDPRYERLSFAAADYYPKLVAELAAAGETETEYDMVAVWSLASPPGNSRRSSGDCENISIAG
jgi:D-amino-acid dehydrogenase